MGASISAGLRMDHASAEALLQDPGTHPTESLSRFMPFGLDGDRWHTVGQSNTAMKQSGIPHFSALHFIALYKCCVSLQIEGKTHYQQKYFNSQY